MARDGILGPAPPPSGWDFEAVAASAGGDDLVALGGDLQPGTLLAAYQAGLFPMGVGPGGSAPLGWWSPDPRGILLPGDLHVSRSLRRVLTRFEVRVDTAFADVVAACADPARPGGWITPDVVAAYTELHVQRWAHSVECWQDGRLVGGLYGLAIGGVFAAESKFHRVRDASKAAVVALLRLLEDGDAGAEHRLVDVQWRTPHLASLGAREVPREEYRARLARAQQVPAPRVFTHPSRGGAEGLS